MGIIARVCSYLADNGLNILDISQTIVDGFFNMMMIVDFTSAEKGFSVVSEELEELGQGIGCVIRLQREEISDKMHRL